MTPQHAPALRAATLGILGAALSLGAAAAGTQAAGELWDYRIQPGDTLIGLHARLMRPDANWRVVQKINRVADPRRLRPGSVLRIPVAFLQGEPVGAEVLHTHGEVFVERAGGAREALKAAATLRAGDVIATGAQSSVSVRFVDGSTALLGPAGRLRIERHSRLGGSATANTQLQLDAGAVETRVVPAKPAPRFELRTPVVNLGVRGTEFRSRIDGARVVTEVLEGQVAVGALPLGAGYGAVATAGRVTPPRPLPAAPSLSGLPTRLERLPLQLAFAATPGAQRYRAQVFEADPPGRMVLDSLFDKPSAAWPDSIPDGAYELRVRAADADGIEGRAARLSFTLKARPEPPFQLKPRAGETLTQDTVVFAWSRHPEAVRYKLQVSTQPDFSPLLLDRSDITGTEFSAALPVGSYHWRLASVRAGDDGGPWGDPLLLVRQPPPPPPPPPAAPTAQPPEATDAGLVIRWAAVPLPGVRYQVQVARDAAFTQLLLDETTAVAERLLPKPEAGTYHVRVRTVGADGRAGAFGQAQVVEVPGTTWWPWLLPLLFLL